MSRRWLVVNADDGGLAPSTDEAILRCLHAGIVRSVTVAVNGPTAAAFVARARELDADIGLHLNLTQGSALAGPHATLTDARGAFSGDKHRFWARAAAGGLDAAELAAETAAQWERLRDMGVDPTHVDGHNHVHLVPAVRRVLQDLAAQRWVRVPVPAGGLPATLPEVFSGWSESCRPHVRCTEHFAGYRFCEEPAAETFLSELPDGGGVVEFMAHPGARPGSTFASSPRRDRETEVLCSPALRAELERRGYRIAGFSDLPCV